MSSRSAREYVAILFALVAAGACRTETGANPATAGSSAVTWRSIADGARTLRYTDADAALVPTFRGAVATGEITVRAFSGLAYLRGYTVAIYPSRVALTAAWRTAWGQPSLTTACWMVAAGWATELSVLSPRTWPTEACGHDPAADAHLRLIIAHELTHVLHAQNNVAYTRMSQESHWLVEGLAVFASGQFEAEYAAQSAARLREGFAPSTFAQLWNDPSAYALAGSLIRYVDVTMGRSTVQRLFGAESLDEVLRILGTSEAALLAAWREYEFNGRVQASGVGV